MNTKHWTLNTPSAARPSKRKSQIDWDSMEVVTNAICEPTWLTNGSYMQHLSARRTNDLIHRNDVGYVGYAVFFSHTIWICSIFHICTMHMHVFVFTMWDFSQNIDKKIWLIYIEISPNTPVIFGSMMWSSTDSHPFKAIQCFITIRKTKRSWAMFQSRMAERPQDLSAAHNLLVFILSFKNNKFVFLCFMFNVTNDRQFDVCMHTCMWLGICVLCMQRYNRYRILTHIVHIHFAVVSVICSQQIHIHMHTQPNLFTLTIRM